MFTIQRRPIRKLAGPLVALAALLAMTPLPALAHRLNEYLQATILSIDAGRVDGTLRMAPGVAVAGAVIARIDSNGDGSFSEAEQHAYAERVLGDLLLRVDDRPLAVRLVSASFPSPADIQQGIAEIQITFTADLPAGGPHRKLVFENNYQKDISVYLVNCLVPRNNAVQIAGQTRNENQSVYQLDFTQQAGGAGSASLPGMSGFEGAFRLGVHHIAEGTDHLLFLLTLLLPAPLLAVAGRWRRRASVRRSLLQVLRIVTAFTVGHSVTLALAAFGLVRLPARPVEVLIAVSILISAVHAIRPLFPGREAAIAGFFGLIHGAAFASALGALGVDHWYRVVSVLGFNLGIEAMQLVAVAASLPSLLLLSRTPAYTFFRLTGAAIAGVASTGWIVERAFDTRNAVGPVIERAAAYAPWIAAALLIFSLICWRWQEQPLAVKFGNKVFTRGRLPQAEQVPRQDMRM